ncbi:MAG TPA: hypothetical protein VFZ21_07960 [Gemmatimonadaceae bacterium]|jgi:hypothetical protein|nr:hypothetical protein [Gemmatimonadaceae bacterium]
MVLFAGTTVAAQPSRNQAASPASRASADSARLAADLFFRAVADERWDAAAAMVDTIIVKHIVSQRLRWRGVQPPQPRPLTVDDFMRDDPNKPRAVAEYELRRYREQMARADFSFLSHEFAGITTLTELSRLSALEATSRYLQAQDFRVQSREAARRSGCPASYGGGPPPIRRILGVALPADTIAYVLHDDGPPSAMVEQPMPRFDPMVLQMRLRSGAWRILPSTSMLRRPGSAIVAVQCDSATRRPPR